MTWDEAIEFCSTHECEGHPAHAQEDVRNRFGGIDLRILTKEELKNEPNGTVYVPFTPQVFTGDIHIITGKENDKGEWNGELPLFPDMIEEKTNKYLTQWCTVDNTWSELDNSKKYAVFSQNEICKMIDCLQWALTGCKSYFNQDEWWSEGFNSPLTDVDVVEDYG